MHVSKMLKMFQSGDSESLPIEVVETDVSNQYTTVISMLNEIKQMQLTESNGFELTEEEAARLIDSVFDFEKKYFKDIPIEYKFSKNFMCNIPRHIYKLTIDCVDKEYPDVFNPMLLLYIFLVEDSDMAYGKFLKILSEVLLNNIDDIKTSAFEYDNYVENVDDEDTNEEVDGYEW